MTNNAKQPVIILVINSLAGRGGERSVLTLAEGFLRRNCEVHIIYFASKIEYQLNPSIHYHFINLRSFKWVAPKALRYKMMSNKVDKFISQAIPNHDLILSNLNQANLIMANSKFKDIAYIIRNTFSEERTAESSKRREQRNRLFAKAFVKHPCIGVSQGVSEDLVQYLQPYLAKGKSIQAHTIYNSFDKQQILQLADEYTVDEGEYIVHVGAFSYAKNHELLLHAYAKSTQKMPLLLLGQGKSEDKIKQLANELGVQDKVKFIGFQSNPYPYIKQAKGMVLSSRYEGFVRVIVEALSLDVPVISTDCKSGPNEILKPHNLSPVGNVDALTSQMNLLMENPQHFYVPFNDKLLPENIAQEFLDYFHVNK